jgi:hypothetical protein
MLSPKKGKIVDREREEYLTMIRQFELVNIFQNSSRRKVGFAENEALRASVSDWD